MILVTGGLGYIGSHTVVDLLEAGYKIAVIDNLSNSFRSIKDTIEEIALKSIYFIEGDIRDERLLNEIFTKFEFDGVIHFAGLKAVAESQKQPLKYYDNNVTGSLTLFKAMARAGVKTLVFSSSATVYGNPGIPQYSEDMPLSPLNVYGRTKRMVEELLKDLVFVDPEWRVACLRYFNPVGAHFSGLIGELPRGIPNNLMPYIAQVAIGRLKKLQVYGNDYPTLDGTGRRDYIHVSDLARGHLLALEFLSQNHGFNPINLGTGNSYSVLEMIQAFERASGKTIDYQIAARRPGDLPEYFANPTLAKQILGWHAHHGIDKMCKDTWHFYRRHFN